LGAFACVNATCANNAIQKHTMIMRIALVFIQIPPGGIVGCALLR
jgi:hypothetical protein